MKHVLPRFCSPTAPTAGGVPATWPLSVQLVKLEALAGVAVIMAPVAAAAPVAAPPLLALLLLGQRQQKQNTFIYIT